ncbi:MAG: sugar kinase [Clostridiales bacterium]|nr:sugar kinase [Clostridiales bacterium]
MRTFEGLTGARLREILQKIAGLRVALLGDVCLDAYWVADMTRSELSRETPHFPLPIVRERFSPGAGGNAAANLAALGPQSVAVFGEIGDDWRGDCLVRAFRGLGIAPEGLKKSPGRFTQAYVKPMKVGYAGDEVEDARLDFQNFAQPPADTEEFLIEGLAAAAQSLDALCVSDQFAFGCLTPRVRALVCDLADQGLTVVVDSRDRIAEYRRAWLKPNDLECSRAAGIADPIEAAHELSRRNGSGVCVTLGPGGCACLAPGGEPILVPAPPARPPLDTVGAGDCFLSAFACGLAAGCQPAEAAALANLASGVVVQKLGVTGTASPDEILAKHKEAQ